MQSNFFGIEDFD